MEHGWLVIYIQVSNLFINKSQICHKLMQKHIFWGLNNNYKKIAIFLSILCIILCLLLFVYIAFQTWCIWTNSWCCQSHWNFSDYNFDYHGYLFNGFRQKEWKISSVLLYPFVVLLLHCFTDFTCSSVLEMVHRFCVYIFTGEIV